MYRMVIYTTLFSLSKVPINFRLTRTEWFKNFHNKAGISNRTPYTCIWSSCSDQLYVPFNTSVCLRKLSTERYVHFHLGGAIVAQPVICSAMQSVYIHVGSTNCTNNLI